MDLKVIAKRVKRGVQLLDRKIPNWRTVLRKHKDEFDFKNGDCCVLGTLEHYSGRMRVLKEKAKTKSDRRYRRALEALQIHGDCDHGFDSSPKSPAGLQYFDRDAERMRELNALDALWRAEFEK